MLSINPKTAIANRARRFHGLDSENLVLYPIKGSASAYWMAYIFPQVPYTSSVALEALSIMLSMYSSVSRSSQHRAASGKLRIPSLPTSHSVKISSNTSIVLLVCVSPAIPWKINRLAYIIVKNRRQLLFQTVKTHRLYKFLLCELVVVI